MLLYKNFLVNISKTCIFVFVFNIYTKSSTINTIKNIKNIIIYVNLFVANKNNNSKKKVISFCSIAFITSIIKKYKDFILNFAF